MAVRRAKHETAAAARTAAIQFGYLEVAGQGIERTESGLSAVPDCAIAPASPFPQYVGDVILIDPFDLWQRVHPVDGPPEYPRSSGAQKVRLVDRALRALAWRQV